MTYNIPDSINGGNIMKRLLAGRPVLALVLFCSLVGAVGASERVLVPTPPGGGEGGVLLLPGDDYAPPGVRLPDDEFERIIQPQRPDKQFGPPYGTIGGDDVEIPPAYAIRQDITLDITDGGILYSADAVYGAAGYEIQVRRSTDGGTTWTVWATLGDPSSLVNYTEPWIQVAEGNQNRCFVAYVRKVSGTTENTVHLTWATLGPATGTFSSNLTVLNSAGVQYEHPRFTTDAVAWDSYYLYLVAGGHTAAGAWDLWFARSANQGTSFESGYLFCDAGTNDYRYPDVSYGYGGYVCVTWMLSSPTNAFDSAIRYRRATGYVGGGLGAWETIQAVTNTTDGFFDFYPRIAASSLDYQAVVAFERTVAVTGGYSAQDPVVCISETGSAINQTVTLANGPFFIFGLEHDNVADQWVLGGERYSVPTLQRADAASLDTWPIVGWLGDRSYYTGSGLTQDHALSLDPSRGGRAGVLWNQYFSSADDTLFFDAEWRRDPGYPVLADGFPVAQASTPVSDPALIDLDRDGKLEVLYSDQAGRIHAVQYNGTELPGWPVVTGAALSDGPVAAAAMYDGAPPFVVVGTTDGRVLGYTAEGGILDGWPVQLPVSAPTYVSIGTLMPPYEQHVVAVTSTHLRVLTWRGDWVLSWSSLGTEVVGPAAIGDIDDDGLNEVVATFGTALRKFDFQSWSSSLLATLPVQPSEAVSLADIDLDGDVEIAVPTANGTLHMFYGNGAVVPGWPFVSPTGSPLTRPAIANILGSYEPEIGVVARNWTAHMLYANGTQHSNWPMAGDGWYINGSPIIGLLEDQYSGDLIVGARGQKVWAWRNVGGVLPGYPRALSANVYQSPAIGDMDGDGLTELVVLSDTELLVFNTHQLPETSPGDHWPMYGYDPARSGCLDCPDLVPTAVEDDDEAVTRIAFAAPWPNPVSDGAMFQFAVPQAAIAELSVVDLRGRRVRTVTREEVQPGRHVTSWDGCDDEGRPLASGHYLARLRIRGAGVDELLTRKVTVVR